MAHTKAKSTTKLGRDSHSKRLGVKLYAGQKTEAGNILVRQRGTKFFPGKNVRRASDDTLYSTATGVIQFSHRLKLSFRGKMRIVTLVNVIAENK